MLRKNQRVRLKHECAGIYGLASGGSEAVIRDLREQEPGYPEAFIVWDKKHWTYNMEPDQWAPTNHFEAVEETPVPDENSISIDALIGFLEAQKGGAKEEPAEDEGRAERAEDENPKIIEAEGYTLTEDPEHYDEVLERGIEAARNAEGFIIITIKDVTPAEAPDGLNMLLPEVFEAYKEKIAGLQLEAQASFLAAQLHQFSNRVLGSKEHEKKEGDGK